MKKLLVAFLLLLSVNAYAGKEDRLTKLDESTTTTTYLVNGSLKSEGSLHSVWVRTEYTEAGKKFNAREFPKVGARAQYSMSQYLYNCENDRMKILSTVIYDKYGAVIASEPMGEAFDIVPGSIGEAVQGIACYYYRNPQEAPIRKSSTF